uniref:Uncharacterized protein n=1 Tax=Arundo donax TaxID=35708 RepID=A0A0A9F1U0_ARUDO
MIISYRMEFQDVISAQHLRDSVQLSLTEKVDSQVYCTALIN